MIQSTKQNSSRTIIELFNQIKPLLEQGHSYASAINMINPELTGTDTSKKIKEYGETQGYPISNYSRRTQYLNRTIRKGRPNKYGLYRVSLVKNPRYLTGYIWAYQYKEDGRLKTISRSDLTELRKVVEAQNLEWKVTDLEKAGKSYELNRHLQKNARSSKNQNTSGIYRVTKAACKKCRQGFIWQYSNKSKGKNIYLNSLTLNGLKEKVLAISEEWIVLDEETARENGLI